MKPRETWFLGLSLTAIVMAWAFAPVAHGDAVLPDSHVLHHGTCMFGSDMDAELLGRGFVARPVAEPQDLWLAVEDDGHIRTVRSPIYDRYSVWRNGGWTIITGQRQGNIECILVVMRDLPMHQIEEATR